MIVSIVIPAYNSKGLLPRLLKSIEQQTALFNDFEVIIIDDGSTDGTSLYLEEYKNTTELNFRWEKTKNKGPANARNYGAQLAVAEWIGFIDADVIADPEWVANTIKVIQANPYVGAIEGRTEISEKHKITFFTHQTQNIHGGHYITCNFIVQKKLVTFYDYPAPFREDSDIAFQIITKGYDIIFDERILIYHPPLNADWKKPIKLAQRYYYDGLLARRFPENYRKEIDCHKFAGIKIPHARIKLMLLHVFSLIIAFFLLFQGQYLMFVFVYLFSLLFAILPAFKAVPINNWKIFDLLKCILISHITPWVLLYRYYKGMYDYRKEPIFKVNS